MVATVAAVSLGLGSCGAGKPLEGALGGSDASLVSVDLQPASVTLGLGQGVDFQVTGEYTDGSQQPLTGVSYRVDGGSIGTDGHYDAGSTPGVYRVIATVGGKSDTSTVLVSLGTAVPVAIVITPASAAIAPGGTQAFTALAQLSDGTDSTLAISWSTTGGTIDGAGTYTAPTQAGNYLVVATQQSGTLADTASVTVAALPPTITRVEVTPGTAALQFGQAQQFTAQARLVDGSANTIAVTWTATGGTVNATGLYTAGSTAGTFRIIGRASNGMADTSQITIAAPTVVTLSISPASVSLQGGQTQQFTRSATLSNGATSTNPSVTWQVTGGTITTGGLYTAGTTAGTFRVIAAAASGAADTSTVTITVPTITALTLTPASATVTAGATQQFLATATLSNGGTQTNPVVNWSATGGTVSTSGLFTAGSGTGTFQVVAALANGTRADTAPVTVTAPGTGPYPNRPASYTKVLGELDMSQAVPPGTGERYLSGFNNTWSVIGDDNNVGSNWTVQSDAGAPRSAPSVWRQRQSAGAYGGGVIGTGSGEGFGAIGLPINSSAVYASFWIKFSPGYFFHPISHKLVRLQVFNAAQAFLLQLRHNDDYFRASDEELGIGYDPIVAGLGGEPSTNVWHQVEMLLIRGTAGTVKVWVDGQLRINNTNVQLATAGNFATFSIEGYLGGGGFTLTADQYFYLDHIFIAGP